MYNNGKYVLDRKKKHKKIIFFKIKISDSWELIRRSKEISFDRRVSSWYQPQL